MLAVNHVEICNKPDLPKTAVITWPSLCVIEDLTSFAIEGHGGHERVRDSTGGHGSKRLRTIGIVCKMTSAT